MVLCPFVYLLLRQDVPPLALQPEEVHSAHWVSIRALLSPVFRTHERCDVSDRFTRQRSQAAKALIRVTAGQLLFSAVHLNPSESLYSDSAALASNDKAASQSFKAYRYAQTWLAIQTRGPMHRPPLLLWGLTLGIVADFLGQIDMEATAKLWSWPTFSHWDIRAIVWMLTYNFRLRRVRELEELSEKQPAQESHVSGLDDTTSTISVVRHRQASEAGLAGAHMLDGYFQRMRKAVALAFSVRLGSLIFLVILLIRRLRR